jgi:hypothetical protein
MTSQFTVNEQEVNKIFVLNDLEVVWKLGASGCDLEGGNRPQAYRYIVLTYGI